MSIRQKRAAWLLLAAAIAILDLWSKGLWEYPKEVPGGMPVDQEIWIEGWLNVRTIWNPGAVWSLDIASTLLLWATGLAIPLVAVWIFWPPKSRRWETAAKCMILGGAIGNFYDRWRWNAVRDWIDVEFNGAFGGWHWPTFNVADMALVGGIGVLLLLSFLPEHREAAE
ncbi:MAG: signal peptidase II [Planctomycetota bacterium]|jgi:signal peptidase II